MSSKQPATAYRHDWHRLTKYLAEQWPGVRPGNPVDTAIRLLEHLRAIEVSGVLPAISDEGTLIQGLSWELLVE